MTGVLSLKPEVSALGSSTLSGALLSSGPPEHEDPIGMFSSLHEIGHVRASFPTMFSAIGTWLSASLKHTVESRVLT